MRKMILAVTLMAVFGAADLTAQIGARTATASASVTIPTLLEIAVTNVTVGFGAVAVSDFDLGYVDATTGASSVSTRGNVEHNVTISADDPAMTGPTGTTKPSTDLEWSTDGSTYTGLTDAGASVFSAIAAGASESRGSVSYRMLLGALDVPGTYSLNFTYTVVAN